MFLSTRKIHVECFQNHIKANDRQRKSLYSSPPLPPGTFPTWTIPWASNISLHQDPTRFKVESKRRQTPGRRRADRTVCCFWRKIWSEILWAPSSQRNVLFITTGFDIRRPWVPRYRLASSRAIHLLLAAPDSQTAARWSPGARRYIIHQVWEPISHVSPSSGW